MAQLKNTVVQGTLRATDSVLTEKVQAKIIEVPSSSNAATYGPGADGQVLLSNGTSTYWGAAPQTVTSVAGKTGAVTLAKGDVGLGNVTNDAQVKRAEMGVASGVATLGTDGKVPTSQLPSYVDDVLEYTAKANFPATGETGKIYVDTTTNLTWRWGGSTYVEISPSLALGNVTPSAPGTAAVGTAATAAHADHVHPAQTTITGNAGSASKLNHSVKVKGVEIGTSTTAQNITFGNAADKAVDTSISAASTSANLPTSAAVAAFVEGKGYITTDTNTHRPIQVNGTQILGDNVTALNLNSGTNVAITNSNGTVTIAATDTTYESKAAASGGTAVSLVTTGEKYTWNNKASTAAATTSANGLMTSAMVTKLNGITESADAVSVSRNLTSGTKIGTITINGTGTDLYCETNTDHITSATTSGSGNAVTAITADANGALTVTKGTTFLTSHQDISGKKNTQSAVNSPTASGTDVAFIDTISQNAQGVITPTKKTVRTFSAATASAAGSTGLVPAPAAGNQGKFLRGDSTWQTVVTDVSGKADKSATVSTVAYDTTNKKITKTINGTTTDVVTTSKLKTDMELDNIGNFKAVSTVASQGLTNTEKLNSRMNINASVNSFPYIDPIESKTYTNVIATANNNQDAGFFFLKIRGDTYHCRWRIKVRLRVTVPGQEFYNTDSVMELWGYANTYSGFVIQNHILSTSYRPFYNHSCFFISETGYDNNCGNWIGFNLAKSTNSTNTSYKRTVICDLLEYENCSYEMVNALYTPDNIPNRENHTNWYTSTNTSFTNFDAYSQGIKMSGDSNTTSISNLYYVNGNYIADSDIFRYQLLFKADENVLTPMNNISNTVSTSKPLLVDKEFDPFSEIYFYNSTTTIAANAAVPAGSLFYAISSFDLRYSFNAGSTLTAHKPVYLQVIMLPNGKCKISGNSPIVQSLPTTADGYYYILLGRSYSTYQMSLFNYHPIYYYDGNTIQQYNGGVPTLTVNIGTVNSFPITKNVPFVTNDMVVIKHIFGTPSSIIGDVTVTTANGQVTLNGSINGSTTIDLILAKTSAINAT